MARNAKQTLLDRLANNRLLNSIRIGYDAFATAYRQDDFVPSLDYGWDTYEARLARYHYNSFYVHNNIYSAVNRYSDWYKHTEGLYKHIRGLRNPISRLVNIEVAKIFGGFINYETFKDGALPIAGADKQLLDAIRTIWQWSNMAAFKQQYPYEGASKGDVAIKVIDDTRREKVYLEVLDPAKVKDVSFDEQGNVKEILICYSKQDESTGKDYEYSEYINKEVFKTFRNKAPYAYIEDERGNGLAEWPNPYGFVPVEWTQHRNLGLNFGAVSFQDSRAKLDNLNDIVSLIHDNVRKNVLTKYAVKGLPPAAGSNDSPSTISLSSDSRDIVPFLKLGTDGDIFPIRSELDIMGALAVVESMTAEIEADLPQLTLSRLQDKSTDMSGAAIEDLAGDGVDIIESLQSTYLAGLSSSTKMALSIAGFRRYPQFRRYNLNSYEQGLLDFDIRPQPIFQDNIRKEKRIELALQAITSEGASVLLPQLGWTDEEVASLEEKRQAAIRRESKRAILLQANELRQTARMNGSNGNQATMPVTVATDENPPAL